MATERRPPSLVLRLTALIGVAAVAVFTAGGWIVRNSIERHFEDQDFGELQVVGRAARRLIAAVRTDADLEPLAGKLSDSLAGHHGMFLYVARADGRMVYATPGADFSAMAGSARPAGEVGRDALRLWADSKHSYRGILLRTGAQALDGGGPFVVIAATATDYHQRYLEQFNRALWAMVAGGIAAMIFMAWIAVRQGHAPLRRIIAQIHRISSDQLHTRISPEEVPVELAELAVSFNEMLDRIEESFRRLANFSADIAHELRTPVANLMTQTQVVLSGARSNEEYREILYSCLEEYERLAQMIGDMLFLAQADDGRLELKRDRVELAAEVRALFDYFEAWAEEHGVALEVRGDAAVSCNRPMLRRALTNLLANAVRHTPAGQAVRVELRAEAPQGACVAVENGGPDIPAEHLPRLFDRFYRVDPSRQRGVDGAGLGLAIVKSIVEAHGGRIAVSSGGRRTRFELCLPGDDGKEVKSGSA